MTKENTQNQQTETKKRNIDRSPEANFRKAIEQVKEAAAKIYKNDSKDKRLTLTDEILAQLEELAK